MIKSVLIVDDCEADRVLVRKHLNKGIFCIYASSIFSAISILMHNTFDAIILDCRMAGVDHKETYEKVRQVTDAKIICVSGYEQEFPDDVTFLYKNDPLYYDKLARELNES